MIGCYFVRSGQYAYPVEATITASWQSCSWCQLWAVSQGKVRAELEPEVSIVSNILGASFYSFHNCRSAS